MNTGERIAELEGELKSRDDKIKELTSELGEARELVDQMREHVQKCHDSVDNWIDVLDMHQDEAGVWIFDRRQSDVWERLVELNDAHNALIRKWNKSVVEFNAKVAPQDIGRPLAASDGQKADVLKRRKAGESIRAIAKATSLGLRTVRTIIEAQAGTDRASKRAKELRRVEFDRQRAAAFRARKARRDAIPKQVTELQKAGAALVKRAKGLGKS